MSQNIISKEDVHVLMQLAEKNEMSLNDFLRCVIKLNVRPAVFVQLRFKPTEIDLIDKKREKMSLSRPKFILFAARSMICSKDPYSFRTEEIRLLKEKRRKNPTGSNEILSVRVSIMISNPQTYREIKQFCSKISLKIGTFMRHCALVYE